MTPAESFKNLHGENDSVRFNEVLRSCIAYLMGAINEKQLNSQLAKNVVNIFTSKVDEDGKPDDRYANIRGLQNVIRLLVGITKTPAELADVRHITDTIIRIVQQHFGEHRPGFGKTICFETISELKSAFWACQATATASRIHSSPRHKVIRINDIPFAESVYPALLARNANKLGYSIVVEDIEWTDVGAALFNNRIDVALYNGQLVKQLKAVETLFAHKMIYKSAPLIKYQNYPIIKRNAATKCEEPKIGIPWKSDFEEVARAGIDKHGRLHVPKTKLNFPPESMIYRASADEVLAGVVDGHLQYGLVGGLQAKYAETQFSKQAPSAKKFHITTIGALQDLDDDEGARFWVAVNRKDEGQELLSAMTTLWNELVVHGWKMAVSLEDSNLQTDLVGIVNGHRHRAYVDDFSMLRKLVEEHDLNLGKSVSYQCIPVVL